MKALVDTSVLVAGMIAQHEFHERALPWIKKAEDPGCELCISSDTLAELYSSLTIIRSVRVYRPRCRKGQGRQTVDL